MLLRSHFTEGETEAQSYGRPAQGPRGHGDVAEKQVPSWGPQAWHHLPLVNTASVCGEPCTSQALGRALPLALPRDKTSVCKTAKDPKVRLQGPCAEPTGIQRSKKLRRASWRRGWGQEWPSTDCSLWKPRPTLLRPLGDNAIGVYPRLHSHPARRPPCRPPQMALPLPPSWGQSCIPSPPQARRTEPSLSWRTPWPMARPLCWCMVLGLPGCLCFSLGNESFKGLRGGFLIN